ncbi:FAD:protein FMN transferase [Deinococcus sp. Leaf326]|uniref:FAD:protein FMN transferase n=1 Tax=Deinococcus sp. Leaf326 TaxID=1736338 RepID=UPI0006F9DD05|nr:FAD:protein FMN transferase [Deinococcus sp. Leaf326]KQR01057.1 nosX protein [Deinococcus sp. Leaf326]
MPRLSALFRRSYHLHSTYERLLGTQVELQVTARGRVEAEAAEQRALAELGRLSALFNRFDPESELRRWGDRPGEPTRISPELGTVLALADSWRQLTGNAFHPGADALGSVWQTAAQAGRLPDPAELDALVETLQAAPWTWHGDGMVTLHARYPLGLNALAKGFIVDRMVEEAAGQPGVETVLVNAGGDLRAAGPAGVTVAVADPWTSRDDAPASTQVRVCGAALATSGQAHRGYDIGGRHYSHVLDPRTGWPVETVPGVTVMAPECATADALATALSVLGPGPGLNLIAGFPQAAALIFTADRQIHRSATWPTGPVF